MKKFSGALPPGPPGKEQRKGKGRGRENGGEGNGKGGVKERQGELGSKAIEDL
jgi:hypothetical protein